jgi:hypothetical protein
MSNGSLAASAFGKAQDEAVDLYYQTLAVTQPWEGRSLRDRKAREFKDYRQRYIDAFGVDPLDPKFKDWERQKIAEWDALQNAPKQVTKEAVLAKRLEARYTGT